MTALEIPYPGTKYEFAAAMLNVYENGKREV
jgi:hypothetical protein